MCECSDGMFDFIDTTYAVCMNEDCEAYGQRIEREVFMSESEYNKATAVCAKCGQEMLKHEAVVKCY